MGRVTVAMVVSGKLIVYVVVCSGITLVQVLVWRAVARRDGPGRPYAGDEVNSAASVGSEP